MSPVPGSGRVEQLAQAVAERVVSIVMDAIDIDALLDRIDVDALISRVDVDKLIDRVDVEKLIERVDVQKIIERVDVEQIIERVDIDALMEKTELGSIIARSTTGVASQVLDVIRAQGVGLDDFFARWVNRVLRRSPQDLPLGPPMLVGPQPPSRAHRGHLLMAPTTTAAPIEGRQGHYAGAVSRLVAFAADVGASWGLFTLGAAALAFSIQLVTGSSFKLSNYQVASLIAAVIWEFVYFAYQWALSGKTHRDGRPRDPGGQDRRLADRCPGGGPAHARPPAELPHPRARVRRHPHQPGPTRPPRPPGRYRRGLLVGRPGGPTALAGQAGPGPAALSRGPLCQDLGVARR